jgi:hypothetical protein
MYPWMVNRPGIGLRIQITVTFKKRRIVLYPLLSPLKKKDMFVGSQGGLS